jgi:ketosteroid isomerase-like protein
MRAEPIGFPDRWPLPAAQSGNRQRRTWAILPSVTSEENVEIVRRVYEGWARGDFSDVESYHPDIDFEMVDWPEGTSAKGIEEMGRAWGATLGAWEDFRSEPLEFVAGGDHVVVVNRITARGKGSGLDTSADTASVWTLEDGKVVRLGLYWDVAHAFDAAGLER